MKVTTKVIVRETETSEEAFTTKTFEGEEAMCVGKSLRLPPTPCDMSKIFAAAIRLGVNSAAACETQDMSFPNHCLLGEVDAALWILSLVSRERLKNEVARLACEFQMAYPNQD